MQRRRLLAAALIVVCVSWQRDAASAQSKPTSETLSGRVLVKDNRLPAPGTRIWVYEAQGSGQYTLQQNSKGEFSITLPEGYYFVFVANLGLIPYAREVWLQHGKPVKLTVLLEPDFAIMQDVRVK